MRLSALLASLTLVTLLFAGCSGDGGEGGGTSTSSSATGTTSSAATSTSRSSTGTTTSSSTTSTGSAAGNTPPAGSISAGTNGTTVTFSLTGSDPDGDTLVWDLTFGDGAMANGTTLPANVNHTYVAAGNYSANFTLTDGTDPVTYNVTVALTGGAGGAAATQDASGSTQGSAAGCGPGILGLIGAGQDYQGGPLEGVEWVKFDVVPGTIGKDFTWSEDPTSPVIAGSFMAFYEASNGFISEDFTGAGTVPEASAFAVFYACGPGPNSFTYHAG